MREVKPLSDSEFEYRANQIEELKKASEQSFSLYRKLIADGWPRELARTILPLSTYSHMFCTVNLLNLFKFIGLRSHEHAQYEIRVYADAMLELVDKIVPVAVKAFKDSRAG